MIKTPGWIIGFFAGSISVRAAHLLCLLLALSSMDTLDARVPLQGSATHVDEVPLGEAYIPKGGTLAQADRLAADYKLQAAEAIYRELLRKNPRHAGALNGLGKIAYYKTTSSNQNLRDQTDALHAEAIQRFMSALRYQPGYVEARVNLASVYMEQGRMGEAGEQLSRVLSVSPNHSQALAKKGEWLVRQERYNEAMPYLEKSIQRNSANASAHYFLAVAHRARNEMDAALLRLNTVLWLEPRNAPAHYQMGLIYEQQGNGAATVEHYLQTVALKPEWHEARKRLADYYEQRGDLTLAVGQLKLLVESAPPDWDIIERIGRLSIKLNQPETAVQYYRRWQTSHPEDEAQVNAALSVAKTELARKKHRNDDLISQGEAKRYAEQAIQFQPNNFDARLVNAKLDRAMGGSSPLTGKEPGEIDVSLQKPALQPYQSFQQGELLLARFQFKEAETALRTARRTGEGSRGDLVFGELFLNLGLPDLAKEAFDVVLRQLPNQAAARLGMAKATEATQQSRELVVEARQNTQKNARDVAILQLERAIKANIKNADAHFLLAQLYEKNAAYGPAADHYYAYLQLEPKAGNAASIRRKIENLKVKLAKQSAQR